MPNSTQPISGAMYRPTQHKGEANITGLRPSSIIGVDSLRQNSLFNGKNTTVALHVATDEHMHNHIGGASFDTSQVTTGTDNYMSNDVSDKYKTSYNFYQPIQKQQIQSDKKASSVDNTPQDNMTVSTNGINCKFMPIQEGYLSEPYEYRSHSLCSMPNFIACTQNRPTNLQEIHPNSIIANDMLRQNSLSNREYPKTVLHMATNKEMPYPFNGNSFDTPQVHAYTNNAPKEVLVSEKYGYQNDLYHDSHDWNSPLDNPQDNLTTNRKLYHDTPCEHKRNSLPSMPNCTQPVSGVLFPYTEHRGPSNVQEIFPSSIIADENLRRAQEQQIWSRYEKIAWLNNPQEKTTATANGMNGKSMPIQGDHNATNDLRRNSLPITLPNLAHSVSGINSQLTQHQGQTNFTGIHNPRGLINDGCIQRDSLSNDENPNDVGNLAALRQYKRHPEHKQFNGASLHTPQVKENYSSGQKRSFDAAMGHVDMDDNDILKMFKLLED